MAGCYGNDPEDRYFEQQLNLFLRDEEREDEEEDERTYQKELREKSD